MPHPYIYWHYGTPYIVLSYLEIFSKKTQGLLAQKIKDDIMTIKLQGTLQ